MIGVILVAPFLIPIPALHDTVDPVALADADSEFVDIDGLSVHFKAAGAGEPAFLLLHGFGASVFSWRDVLPEFAQWGRVIAYDRPAFGLTERPTTWTGANPYSAAYQTALVLGLLDALGQRQVILVAHSAGARVAVDVALTQPQRVMGLILVDPAISVSHSTWRWLLPLLHTPQLDRLGPLLVRSIARTGDAGIRRAWHDQAKLTSEVFAGYRKPLRADNWDVALWEFTRADRAPLAVAQLQQIARIPTLLITGDDDRIVPAAQTIALAGVIGSSELRVLPQCGHLPHEECPGRFMAVVEAFLSAHALLTPQR